MPFFFFWRRTTRICARYNFFVWVIENNQTINIFKINFARNYISICFTFMAVILTHFMPLISFDTPWNPEVFWCSPRVSKEIRGMKWVKLIVLWMLPSLIIFKSVLIGKKLWISPFKRQPHNIDKHAQTICRQFADELFECVWPFCEVVY